MQEQHWSKWRQQKFSISPNFYKSPHMFRLYSKLSTQSCRFPASVLFLVCLSLSAFIGNNAFVHETTGCPEYKVWPGQEFHPWPRQPWPSLRLCLALISFWKSYARRRMWPWCPALCLFCFFLSPPCLSAFSCQVLPGSGMLIHVFYWSTVT